MSVLLVLVLTGCGGGATPNAQVGSDARSSSGETVVSVEGRQISHATLRHWMLAMTGGDFYEVAGKRAPAGLVSEPADYPRCELDVKQLLVSLPRKGKAVTGAQVATKCRELYSAIKQQTLGFLISSQLKIGEAAKRGVRVSNRDVERQFASLRAERFPSAGQLAHYLSERRWAPADELYLVRLNLLSSGLQRKLQSMSRASLIKLSAETMKSWSAKTSCQPGFVVQHCKQYRGKGAPSGPSAAVLIEEATGRL